jgi:hypothetical protein
MVLDLREGQREEYLAPSTGYALGLSVAERGFQELRKQSTDRNSEKRS